MVSLVVFRIGQLRCALPVGRVSEIVPAQPSTRIPGAGQEVEGLVNVRGRLLTVVDGRRLLSQDDGAGPADPSILVLSVAGRPTGLRVDDVEDLIRIPDDAVEPHGALPGVDPRVAESVARWEGHVVVVLAVESLLAPVFGG